MLSQILLALSSPGRAKVITGSAPTRSEESEVAVPKRSWWTYLDRALDFLVRLSGSWPVFFLVVASVLAWALAGIWLGRDTTWQVFISDYQAILTYFFDSLLMRQQLRDFDGLLGKYAVLQSRMLTHQRLLARITEYPELLTIEDAATQTFPEETRITKVLTRTANVLGHIISVGVFWTGIIIWIGFGQSLGWSNTWQLYINSATSALMVFLFAFLALCREQHSDYSTACVKSIEDVDRQLETTLRNATHDGDENPTVILRPPVVGTVQRAINYYAVLISMLVGIAMLTAVIIIWAALGPVMQFGDNWWLLIGTYAGLIGMIDGFVLRNVDEQLVEQEESVFTAIGEVEDAAMSQCALLGEETLNKVSLSSRVSKTMNRICSHRYMVLSGLATAVILIIAASSLQWSFTGQLLCNVPPSIIESFFMIILITGHNDRNASKLAWLKRVHARRIQMLGYVQALTMAEKK